MEVNSFALHTVAQYRYISHSLNYPLSLPISYQVCLFTSTASVLDFQFLLDYYHCLEAVFQPLISCKAKLNPSCI